MGTRIRRSDENLVEVKVDEYVREDINDVDTSKGPIDDRLFGPESFRYVWWNLIETPSFAAEIPKSPTFLG